MPIVSEDFFDRQGCSQTNAKHIIWLQRHGMQSKAVLGHWTGGGQYVCLASVYTPVTQQDGWVRYLKYPTAPELLGHGRSNFSINRCDHIKQINRWLVWFVKWSWESDSEEDLPVEMLILRDTWAMSGKAQHYFGVRFAHHTLRCEQKCATCPSYYIIQSSIAVFFSSLPYKTKGCEELIVIN